VQVVEPEAEREEQKEMEEKSGSRDEKRSKVHFDEEERHIKSVLDEPMEILTETRAEAPTRAPSTVPNNATKARSKRRKSSIQWNLFFFP